MRLRVGENALCRPTSGPGYDANPVIGVGNRPSSCSRNDRIFSARHDVVSSGGLRAAIAPLPPKHMPDAQKPRYRAPVKLPMNPSPGQIARIVNKTFTIH